MKILNKILDVLLFVIGTFILFFNLFDFGPYSNVYGVKTAFYYQTDTTFGIALGASMIAFGFLRMYWSKE